MPEYIGRNTEMLGALLRAEQMKAERPTKTAQEIAQAVAGAINTHYKAQEEKIAQRKADKLKESLALIDFVKNFETQERPQIPGLAGVPGAGVQPAAPSVGPTEQVAYPPQAGYEAIPQAIRNMGVQAEFMRPREKQYESADASVVAAYNKTYGTNFPPGTNVAVLRADASNRRPQKEALLGEPQAADLNKVYPNLKFTADMDLGVAKTMIAQDQANRRVNMTWDRRAQVYGKFDQAYSNLSKMAINLPPDNKYWTAQDFKTWQSWVDATNKRGITIDDVQVMASDSPQDAGFFAKILEMMGWKIPAGAKAPEGAPSRPKVGGAAENAPAGPGGQLSLPGLEIGQ